MQFPLFFGILTSVRVPHSLGIWNNLLQFRVWVHLCPGTMSSTGGFRGAMDRICMEDKGGKTTLTHPGSTVFLLRLPTGVLDWESMIIRIRITICLSKAFLITSFFDLLSPLDIVLSLLPFTDKLLLRLSSPCLHFFTSQSSFTVQHMVGSVPTTHPNCSAKTISGLPVVKSNRCFSLCLSWLLSYIQLPWPHTLLLSFLLLWPHPKITLDFFSHRLYFTCPPKHLIY